MKPTIKEIARLRDDMTVALKSSGLSFAEIGKLSDVDASQVGRICKGNFKTLSHNLVQVCNVLKVSIPTVSPKAMDRDLAIAHSSLIKIWDQTPQGARIIRRMLDSIAELQTAHADEASPSAE
ncbi:hypothetical protein U1763_02455 [Sphingomonas sp. LB2R24]|uniref:hypothetical protein n=1 Tax=Sphingomonas sorbitolis TaxID=3096165 RepID=UPI002FCC1779